MTIVLENQTEDPNLEPARRRRRVGLVAAIFGIAAGVGFGVAPENSAWPAACLRIGIVFGALWLCLPAKRRPKVWKNLSVGRLVALAVLAILVNRLKYLFPVIGVLTVIAWVLRPRRAATQLRR